MGFAPRCFWSLRVRPTFWAIFPWSPLWRISKNGRFWCLCQIGHSSDLRAFLEPRFAAECCPATEINTFWTLYPTWTLGLVCMNLFFFGRNAISFTEQNTYTTYNTNIIITFAFKLHYSYNKFGRTWCNKGFKAAFRIRLNILNAD